MTPDNFDLAALALAGFIAGFGAALVFASFVMRADARRAARRARAVREALRRSSLSLSTEAWALRDWADWAE